MAEPTPDTFVNVIALAIAVLPFFATNALDRLEVLDDDGVEGYVKFGIMVTLFYAFLVTVIVATLVLNIGGTFVGGLQITAAYFLFVALYLPTLGLFIPVGMQVGDYWTGEELDNLYMILIFLAVSSVVVVLARFNPV